MGFGLWIDLDNGLAWAQGTHEYRPMGAAVIATTDQFRHRDFRQTRRRPRVLQNSFAGFFGSLEEVNARLRSHPKWKSEQLRRIFKKSLAARGESCGLSLVFQFSQFYPIGGSGRCPGISGFTTS